MIAWGIKPEYDRHLVVYVCLLLSTVVWSDRAAAQAPAPVIAPPATVDEGGDTKAEKAEVGGDVFLRPQRELLQRLNNARRLIDQRRFSEAVRSLGWILECDEDYFVRGDDGSAVFESLKSQAQSLIGRMPAAGRDLYELEYGAKARARLEEAAAGQDATGLAEVSRRYFHTLAGGEATLLLGLWNLDHGRPLAAALILSRLSESPDGSTLQDTARLEPTLSVAMAVCWAQAGLPGKANECLESLRSRYPSGRVTIGGREVALFAVGEDPLEWLESQTGKLFAKAAPANKGAANDGIPLLNTLWRANASEHPAADRLLRSQLQYCRERDLSIISAGRPLAVGDKVLLRTVDTLEAIDFQTGKIAWIVPFDDILDEEPVLARNAYLQAGQQIGELCNRYWQDGIYGSLSSDGNLVFSVEDLDTGIGLTPRQIVMLGQGAIDVANLPGSYNRLSAHDIKTGKLVWQIGGEPGDEQTSKENSHKTTKAVPAAGGFFLGAGLCFSGKLYSLAEFENEIRLVALNAASGKLLWTQPLAVVESEILQDRMRRLTAAVPSYADGVLICPTGNGAVVAVEEATHSLLWGYAFPEETNNDRFGQFQRQQALMAAGIPGYSGRAGAGRFYDDIKIVGDRVLVAEPYGEYIYCLGLFDGKLHWKTLRKGDLFMACADSERVVLVGAHHARALKLSDGKAAWPASDVSLGDGSATSGRGFLAGGYYYIPVGKAGVAVLDIQSGHLEQVTKSREGNIPGNLVCHNGRIFSQGLDGLKSYYELGTLARRVDSILTKTPDDARALALQGEMLIDRGERKQAIDALRRSYEQIGGARTEWLLRETLLDGLAEEFAEYRQDAAEIEKLCKEPRYRARYLRLTAEGLQAQQEWDSALDCYLHLADLADGADLTDVADSIDRDGSTDAANVEVRLSDVHSVLQDRWLRVRLASFANDAPDDARKRLDAEAEKRLAAAMAAGDLDRPRRFLDRFAYHPVAVKGRDLFVDRLISNGNLLEAEMFLRQEARSRDRAVAAQATLRLAEVLRKAKRPEDAADCYRRLAFEFADVTIATGITGKEIVKRLPKDDVVRHWFQPDRSWPVGVVESAETLLNKDNVQVPNSFVDLNFHGSRRPFFDNANLKYNQSTRSLVAVGAYGNLLWQISLAEPGQRNYLSFNQSVDHVSARGHLLVIAAGNEYIAVDCADPNDPKILWRRFPDQSLMVGNSMGQAEIQAFWGGMRQSSAYGRSSGHPWQTGLLTDQYMCFCKFRSVAAIDPITGRDLWTQGNLPENCMLFGDESLLFAVPFDGAQATVLRGADGEILKTVAVPPPGDRLTTIGRNVLVWRVENNQRILELVDPWQGRTLWGPHKFQADAKCSLVGGESLGIMEPSGHFVMISLPDGRKRIEAQLEPEPDLHEIVVLEADGEHFLVTHSPPKRQGGHTPRAIRGTSSQLIRKGRVYGFDRSGKRLWPDFPEGVEVEQQQLLLEQPGRLPVLTFVSLGYNPNRQSRWFTSVFMIDKRTGRVVVNKPFPQQSGTLELMGDPAGNTVDMRMQRSNLRLSFTDKALPPITKKKKADKPSGAFGGVLKALQKVGQQQMRLNPIPVQMEEEEMPAVGPGRQ